MLPESDSIVTSDEVFAPALTVSDHAELQAWIDATEAEYAAHQVSADLDAMWAEEQVRRDAAAQPSAA